MVTSARGTVAYSNKTEEDEVPRTLQAHNAIRLYIGWYARMSGRVVVVSSSDATNAASLDC